MGERSMDVTRASLLAGETHKRMRLGRAGRWCPSVGPSVSAVSCLWLHLGLEPLPGDRGLLLDWSRRFVCVDRELTGETLRHSDGHSHHWHDRPSGRAPSPPLWVGKGQLRWGAEGLGRASK